MILTLHQYRGPAEKINTQWMDLWISHEGKTIIVATLQTRDSVIEEAESIKNMASKDEDDLWASELKDLETTLRLLKTAPIVVEPHGCWETDPKFDHITTTNAPFIDKAEAERMVMAILAHVGICDDFTLIWEPVTESVEGL